jgi:phage gp36-like protein
MPSRYLTVEELLALRGEAELLRLAGPGGGPPFPALTAAIEQAEAEATSYLLGRYRAALPSTPAGTPPILKAKVASLAHRKLLAGGQPSPALEAEAQQTLSWLRDVARGAASLDLPTASPADNTSPTIAALAPAGPGLRLEDLEAW